MGVEEWETKYKVPDSSVLDDYLDASQKMWEDEDKSIIYKISDNLWDTKGSRFYQTVECDELSSEGMAELDGGPQQQRHGFGSGEVRLVYKEAGSFEDESSPPEIDIIHSVKKHQQQLDTESLLYKTRLWAKTALEDTLESYAAFRKEAAQEEAARIRGRIGYDSVGSDEMQYSFGSEEDLDDLAFTGGDASYEYESYYYPDNYLSDFGGQYCSSKGRTGHGQDSLLSPIEEPSDNYIDAMDELQNLVHSVSEYLAVKEEEIKNYESMPKPIRRRLPALPTTAKVVQPAESKSGEIKPEVKEDSAVEQGIVGVKNAMSSLLSTITGSKSTSEAEGPNISTPPLQPPQADSSISKLLSLIPKANNEAPQSSGNALTVTPTSQASAQPESGISKMLSFISKSGNTSLPVAVVPPASQEHMTEKKFSLQSLLPFQSSETSQQADADQASTHVGSGVPESAASANQSTSGFESMLGRLSPLRLFSSTPSSREPSPQPSEQQNESASYNESQHVSRNRETIPNQEGLQIEQQLSSGARPVLDHGTVALLPDTGSCSIEHLQETGSGSVELLPETESSGELPDIQQRRTATSDLNSESHLEDAGFFSPFKKSLSTFISTLPSDNSSQVENKTTGESFLGGKLKVPFFSSDNVSSASPPKTEEGMLSGILKLASSDDSNTSPKSPISSPVRTPSPSCAALLESVPKGNTETGWFSNLFKATPSEPCKHQAKPQMTPIVTLTKPSGQTDPQMTASTSCKTEISKEKILTEKDPQWKIDTQTEPDVKLKDQSPSQTDKEAKSQSQTQAQGFVSGLFKLRSNDVSSDKKAQKGHPQQDGLFSGLFASPSRNDATQQSGLLSGFLQFATDNVSVPTNQPLSTLPGDQSGHIHSQTQRPPALPPAESLFSGLLKKATDTVTGSQPTHSSQELQPDLANITVKIEESPKYFSHECSPHIRDKTHTDQLYQQQRQCANLDDKQKQSHPTTEMLLPKPITTMPQPGELFGGLSKLTETASHSPKEPLATQSIQTNQQSGDMLSGLLNKIKEPNPTPSQQPSGPQKTHQRSSQQGPLNQGGFLSGLFGIGSKVSDSANPAGAPQNQQQGGTLGQQSTHHPDSRQNQQRQNQVPPHQPPSSPGGILTGLLNKIVDAGTTQSTVGSQHEQRPLSEADRSCPSTTQQLPNQQGSFFSALFSTGPTPAAQQSPHATDLNQQQLQQGNRQPLKRQNQIPPQPSASASEPHQQQPGKMANPQQPTSQPNQSGGLLSGILKLASGDSLPQEQSQPAQASQPLAITGQNPAQVKTGGLFSGLIDKISGTAEMSPSPSDGTKIRTTPQYQARTGQGRPQIQRTKPVEMHSSQDAPTDKDIHGLTQKGTLSGLFNVTQESSSKTKQDKLAPQPGKEDPEINTNSTSGLCSSIFKPGPTDNSISASGNKTEKGHLDHLLPRNKENTPSYIATLTTNVSASPAVTTQKRFLQTQVWQDPTVSPTQRYLDEIQRLLYGTADEYGYKDLLYNFTEHGVIPPELYEHQCLIEALLWQQLNDYALTEALAVQVEERSEMSKGYTLSAITAPQSDNQIWLNPMEMNMDNFNIPLHPWQDNTAVQVFVNKNSFLETAEDFVLFDMSCREKKTWNSCEHLNDMDKNTKPWIFGGSVMNLSMEKTKTHLSRCQSLTACSVQEFSKVMEKSCVSIDAQDEHLNLKAATEFLKRLATKKGPVDLTHGAMDLSTSAGARKATYEEMLFEDSEWYQQWLSLLEQGLWWSSEDGDCGYYVYTDEEYVYSLLTDRAGRHLYACAAPEDVQGLGNINGNITNILKQEEQEKVTLCGFKIPLCSEDSNCHTSGQQYNKSLLSDMPIDLTSALKKGEKIMNMNLESFSQMFQESLCSQTHQPVDFTVYKLKKIKVESIKNNSSVQEEPMEAADLTLKSLKGGHGGPYWMCQGIKDSVTLSSALSSKSNSKQIFPNIHNPIPEIRIVHADHKPEEQPKEKSGPRNLPETPSASEVLGIARLERKLYARENVTKTYPGLSGQAATLPTTFSSTVATSSVSLQKPQHTRQPSQVDKPRILPQTNKTTAAGICDNSNAKYTEATDKNQCKAITPQLHILNENSITSHETQLYSRNHNTGTPIDSQPTNKVLDFSTKTNKNLIMKQKDTINANVKLHEDKVVDFTKYKLKIFKPEERMGAKANFVMERTTIAVDLCKEYKREEDQECLFSECMAESDSQQGKATHISNMAPNQHSKSERETRVVHSSSEMHVQIPPASYSTSVTEAKMTFTFSSKGAVDTSKPSVVSTVELAKISNSKTKLSATRSLSGEVLSLGEYQRQPTKRPSSQSAYTSLMVSPITKKQTDLQVNVLDHTLKIQLKMQKSPSLVRTGSLQQTLCCMSSGKAQEYQETTAPANSVKGTLDMSAKTTQQSVVLTKDPVCEAVSLTKKEASTSKETETNCSCYESMDLSYRGVTVRPQEQTIKCNDLEPVLNVEEHSSHFIQGNQTKCSIKEEISPWDSRRTSRRHAVFGHTELLEICKVQLKGTAPANTVKATLDLTSKTSAKLNEVASEVATDDAFIKAIPLMKGKLSSRELARKNSVGVPLVVDITDQDPITFSSTTNTHQEFENKNKFHSDSILCKDTSHHSRPSLLPLQAHEMPTSIKSVIALDMSLNPSKVMFETKTAVNESTPSEAISLIYKPLARAVGREDSVGIPLLKPTLLASTSPKEPQRLLHDLKQPLSKYMTLCRFIEGETSSVAETIIRPYPLSTAPANSIKSTIDMSTKACKPDTVLNDSDLISLVRRRPSSFAYSESDSAGVPLIVEPSFSLEQLKSEQVHCGIMHCGSQEINHEASAPSNSNKGFFCMSPKPQQKNSETGASSLSMDTVQMVKNYAAVKRNNTVNLSFTVEQSVGGQGLRRHVTTEPLPKQISTYQNQEVFVNSRSTYKDTHPQNTPVDFSANDSQKMNCISSKPVEPVAGQPLNFTNSKAKKEITKKHTRRKLQKKTLPGIVDLTMDPQTKSRIISPPDATDLSYSLSQSIFHHHQQQLSLLSLKGREDKEFLLFPQHREYPIVTQATTGTHYKLQTETAMNTASISTSFSSFVPTEINTQDTPKVAPLVMQHSVSATLSLNTAYQEINSINVESKKADLSPLAIPQINASHQAGVNIIWTESIAKVLPKLQRQDTDVQYDQMIRPEILIKQPTVDRCWSTEVSTTVNSTLSSNNQELPSFSTQQQHDSSQAVSTPQSCTPRPLTTLISQQAHDKQGTYSIQSFDEMSGHSSETKSYNSKEPLQFLKQFDPCPVPVSELQCNAPIVPSSTETSENSAQISQLTSENDPLKVTQAVGAKTQRPVVSLTATGPSSVKGLVSLFSGLGSHSVSTKPFGVSHSHIQNATTSVDFSTQVTPEQSPVFIPVAVTPDTSTLSTSFDQANALHKESISAPSLITEPQYQRHSSVLNDVSPQTTPVISSALSSMHDSKAVFTSDIQPLQSKLDGSQTSNTTDKELPFQQSSSDKSPGAMICQSQGDAFELSGTLTEVISKIDMSLQQSSEEIKEMTSTESTVVNIGPEVSAANCSSQEKIIHPRPIDTDNNFVNSESQFEPGKPKPYVRLPHIFVSTVSSPEEEVIKHSEFSKPELSEVNASENTTSITGGLPDQIDSHETKITDTYAPPFELCSKDRNIADSDATTLEVVKPLTDVAHNVEIKTLVSALPDDIEESENIVQMDKSKATEAALTDDNQFLHKLSLKETPITSDIKLPQGDQTLSSKTEDIHLSASQSDPLQLPPEETTTKDDHLEVSQLDRQTEQPNEQPGKGLLSMFSGSSATLQQTTQTGLSVFGGILPGSLAKDTPGTVSSVFGGSNAPSSLGSKDLTQPVSVPHETKGKGLFSMLSGSSSQSSSGSRDSTSENLQARAPSHKEPTGKSMFSIFGGTLPEQPPSMRDRSVGSATPKGPSTGSSIFGGILPSSVTHKQTPGDGLFSKFGNLSQQCQPGPRMPSSGPAISPLRGSEPSGKGLLSMFGGQNHKTPEAHPEHSKVSESDGIFKVSSAFSLGGSSDTHKSKAGFSLFGFSFTEETKRESEISVRLNEEVVSEEAESPNINSFDLSREVKDYPLEVEKNVPSESHSASLKLGHEGEQVRQHSQGSNVDIHKITTEISVSQPEMNEIITIQKENSPVVGGTDKTKINIDLPENETLLDQQAVKISEDQPVIKEGNEEMQDAMETRKDIAKLEINVLENKSKGDESGTATTNSQSEKMDIQMPENALGSTHQHKISDMIGPIHVKAAAEGDMAIPNLVKQSAKPLKVAEKEWSAFSTAEKLSETLKVDGKDQRASANMGETTEESFKLADKEPTATESLEVLTEKPSEAVSEKETAVADLDKSSREPLIVSGNDQAAIADMEILKEVTLTDSVRANLNKPVTAAAITITVAAESVDPEMEISVAEDMKALSDGTVKNLSEPKFELGQTCEEPANEKEKPVESNKSVAMVCSLGEEKTAPTDLPEVMNSQAVKHLTCPTLKPTSLLQQQQPTLGIARPTCSPGQRVGAPGRGIPQMGDPRMTGPRMGGQRMTGPRHPGQQKPSEPAPFSGFMSMFSAPSGPTKSPITGGFFSSSPGSLFGSPAPRQPQQQHSQQNKSSFFGLPSSIATESITTDLFGIFKGSETTKSEAPQQPVIQSEQPDPSSKTAVINSTEIMGTEPMSSFEDANAKSSGVPENGVIEEAAQKDKAETEEINVYESVILTTSPEAESGDIEQAENVEGACLVVVDKASATPDPETKSIFEIPELTAEKFSSMSIATDGTSSIGSLFTSSSSSSKNISASIFQEEKPTGREEPSSVFGMQLGSMVGHSELPKPDPIPYVVTVQPQPQIPKPANDYCDPDVENSSPESGRTESADASDTDTSKTGSCDTLAQSPQLAPHHHSGSLVGLEKSLCEVDRHEIDQPDGMHADVDTEQPKDLTTMEASKRQVQFFLLTILLIYS